VSITSRSGLTIETHQTTLAGSNLFDSLNMKIGAIQVSVDPKKIHHLDVLKVEGQTAQVKLALRDGTEQTGSLSAGPVKGHFAFGEVIYPLADISRLSFDFRQVGETADDRPDTGDGPFSAAVVDIQGSRFTANDMKAASSGSGHLLTVVVDSATWQIDFNYLRQVEVLLAPRGGVIVRLTLLGDRVFVGFIPRQQVGSLHGSIGYAQFDLDLDKLRTIRFE
jgi:hypothetical protein